MPNMSASTSQVPNDSPTPPGFPGVPSRPSQEAPGFLSSLPTRHPLCYLVLHQHGDVHEHVVKLLDAALQPHDVLVPSLDLTEGLLGNLRVDDLGQAAQRPTIGHHAHRSLTHTPAGLLPPRPPCLCSPARPHHHSPPR